MPLIKDTRLPSFQTLLEQGIVVLPPEIPSRRKLRDLHIGFLNLMPDGAFQATERQFLRLLGASDRPLNIFIHPFTIWDDGRTDEIKIYIQTYYESFETLQEAGLDALIITGTNPANSDLEDEPFWKPLTHIVDWALREVNSVMCSCLAVHAIVKQLHDIDRRPLATKRWGVYPHLIQDPAHPLLKDIDSPFDVPHSRNNDVSAEQLKDAGFKTLVAGTDGDVHMAVGPDHFRLVFLQGHPEYDDISLLKEYKRETIRFFEGSRDSYPDPPENYFNAQIKNIIEHYQASVMSARAQGESLPAFPEADIRPHLRNTWSETGQRIFNNWLGLVIDPTAADRNMSSKPYSDQQDSHRQKA